jgi:hypothetical protein
MKKAAFIMMLLVFTVSCTAKVQNDYTRSPEPTTAQTEFQQIPGLSETGGTVLKKTAGEGNPVYASENRYSDEGVENDLIYTFSNGEVNPLENELVFLFNGTFNSNVKASSGYPYVICIPLKELVLSFGGDVKNEQGSTFTYTLNENSVTVVIGEYNVPSEFIVNGKSVSISDYQYENENIYVSLNFIIKYLGLEYGYLPGGNVPYSITYNPLIWVDYPGSSNKEDYARGQALEQLKKTLKNGLEKINENGLSSVIGTDYESWDEDFKSMAEALAEDIDNIHYFCMVGRYAIYTGCHKTILIDTDTDAVYYYISGHLYGNLSRYNGLGSSDFFTMFYISG